MRHDCVRCSVSNYTSLYLCFAVFGDYYYYYYYYQIILLLLQHLKWKKKTTDVRLEVHYTALLKHAQFHCGNFTQ